MFTILVIEDHEDIRDNTIEILEIEGYRAIGAKNSELGFELAKIKIPDIIICGVRMPGVDCHEFLNKLKCNNTTSKIPFVFILSNAEKENIQEGLNFGAAGYLVKPFETDELLTMIKNILT